MLFISADGQKLYAQSSDNGDGTFTNPVLWTDLPDPDVTQVGDTLYMVSTSMHLLPGVTILKSLDLVNWDIATNVVPQFDDDPFFNMQGGNRYGKGQWATALRYWNGEFHVLFTSNTNGCFIYSSPTMQGAWRKTVLYDGPYHPILDRQETLKEQNTGDGFYHHILYDPGFLVDNDGRIYVVHGNSINYITEIDPVACQAKTKAREIYRAHREGLEGNRLYHIGNYYYIICTYGGSHSGNVTCLRSHTLEGPWEEREVFRCGARQPESHLLQACLIPLKSGETWAMTFLDMGVLGRIPHLVPVHWIDGWPVFGGWDNGNITLTKPNVDVKGEPMQFPTSDDFSSKTLGLQWQFNHNPDWSHISLTERPGYLRLHSQLACQSLSKKDAESHLVTDSNPVSRATIEVSNEAPFLMARNTITQRLFGPQSQATAKVDASGLRTSDSAGLALLNIPYGTLTISRNKNGFCLSQTEGDNLQESQNECIILTKAQTSNLWLRTETEASSGLAHFSYSLDGTTFKPLGKTFKMNYSGSYFVGNRLAIFCYSTKSKDGGFLDIDEFNVNVKSLFDKNIDKGTTLEAEYTDALWRTECHWTQTDDSNPANMDISFVQDGGMIAFNRLQFKCDITQMSFSVKNIAGHHVFIELKDAQTCETLGKAAIPEPTDNYVEVKMTLSRPLISNHRIEIRIWNQDWDQPQMGEVLMDKFTFK